ncbi:26s protease regulatory subunit 6a [Plasmopara halstedii]|uniref:26s protease regulatory subunit 6a n=1 Tax=Plasmopara halstedii TaxID=4781 RepID=A0A0P1B831_PLAHL|nr:26s protease regulatory subunit 6a [Plasmopara halstedii]CEG50156.1 26s protease regulatory subunit 6a [Plasmopara halstedii]|eukprot:XP_024586525.1 26s protease regulatory subunit 6a [Plasmopara halstedii]
MRTSTLARTNKKTLMTFAVRRALLLSLFAVCDVSKIFALQIPWNEYWETVMYHTGLSYQCTFVDKPSQVVRQHLQENLKGQERAVEAVVGAIEAWEFSQSSTKDRAPLVLAITGPTGTGKTEMSNLIAEALFKRKKKLPNSERRVPTGLLMFRGEDFSDNFTNPITEYHTQIKTRLAEHLIHCSGKAVVVIDEVQKVIPHTLDVFMEAVSESSQLSYYKHGVTKNIDTANVIFVLVSDIGVGEMEQVMIQYDTRDEIPTVQLERVVKSALDNQWKRLDFGKMIDQVIPFLPFEHQHIVEIIALKLRQLDENYRGKYWHRLWIEDHIADYMSRLDSVHYKVRSAVVNGKIKSSKVFAKYGARDVETGPIQLLKSKLLRYLRPFNPDAEIRISQDVDTKEISIVSCAMEVAKKTIKPKRQSQSTADDNSDDNNEFVHVGCVTKWADKMSELESSEIWGADEQLDPEILLMSNEELRQRIRLLDNNIRIMRSDIQRINHESNSQRERIKENNEKVKLNKQLPYLVANVVEVLELEDDEDEQDGAATDVDAARKGKSAVIKTSTRQTIFLPIPGLVDSTTLIPNDLVGVNKDSYLILEKLPSEYDSRVKAMEVDEKPTEEYSDIGGLDKQIQELVEAVVLPMTHKERFEAIGIMPPKGVLLHGPPGTGKTLLARACAKQTDAIFLKLAAPQLVQMFIGDGAKLVRDAFELAKEKCKDQDRGGAIIFIDELDAIGTKRFGGEQSGDREVQRTMLELLNQLDGFTSNTKIKVIAATNRPDVLDPALLRSGRLDRKIELPHPTEEARARILQIHSRKMNVDTEDTNFDELARSTDDFNGAQLKAVCVEAGMLALRRESNVIKHEDFMEGISLDNYDFEYFSLKRWPVCSSLEVVEWSSDQVVLLIEEDKVMMTRGSSKEISTLYLTWRMAEIRSEPNFLEELALDMRVVHFASLDNVIIEVNMVKKVIRIEILGVNQNFGDHRTATVSYTIFCKLRMIARARFLMALALVPAMQSKKAQIAQGRAAIVNFNRANFKRCRPADSLSNHVWHLREEFKANGMARIKSRFSSLCCNCIDPETTFDTAFTHSLKINFAIAAEATIFKIIKNLIRTLPSTRIGNNKRRVLAI